MSEEKNSFWQGIKEWIRVIIIAFVIAIPIRYFIAEPFIVNGASMDPTFSSGQFLIVDRLSYRFEPPNRGDVIVFKYPNNPSIYYIKRIIGLPGERVRLDNGSVTIERASTSNFLPSKIVLNEPYVQNYHISRETLVLPETGDFLGSNQYVVMGDNRAESSDSRVWGSLDYNFIIGRPILRLIPLAILPGQHNETIK